MNTAVRASKGLKLTDILVTIVIAVVFGLVYKIWGPAYDLMKPFGLHTEQLMYGMWFMAGTFAYLIIRKPGVAILAEVAAATVSAFLGSEWGCPLCTMACCKAWERSYFCGFSVSERKPVGCFASCGRGGCRFSDFRLQLRVY